MVEAKANQGLVPQTQVAVGSNGLPAYVSFDWGHAEQAPSAPAALAAAQVRPGLKKTLSRGLHPASCNT